MDEFRCAVTVTDENWLRAPSTRWWYAVRRYDWSYGILSWLMRQDIDVRLLTNWAVSTQRPGCP